MPPLALRELRNSFCAASSQPKTRRLFHRVSRRLLSDTPSADGDRRCVRSKTGPESARTCRAWSSGSQAARVCRRCVCGAIPCSSRGRRHNCGWLWAGGKTSIRCGFHVRRAAVSDGPIRWPIWGQWPGWGLPLIPPGPVTSVNWLRRMTRHCLPSHSASTPARMSARSRASCEPSPLLLNTTTPCPEYMPLP